MPFFAYFGWGPRRVDGADRQSGGVARIGLSSMPTTASQIDSQISPRLNPGACTVNGASAVRRLSWARYSRRAAGIRHRRGAPGSRSPRRDRAGSPAADCPGNPGRRVDGGSRRGPRSRSPLIGSPGGGLGRPVTRRWRTTASSSRSRSGAAYGPRGKAEPPSGDIAA